MEKYCAHCGKAFITDYPSKLYCSKKCSKAARFERDESYYNYLPESPEPLYSFECRNCGKKVYIYSKYDQRSSYCCGLCAKEHELLENRERRAKRKGSNLGMSGAMSLGSLIRREARALKD